tara:strand:- start:110 stop:319 length:210 start_codon:yes stop_codon:yes gene_type:complete
MEKLNLSKDEAMFIYQVLEETSIKGKGASGLVKIFEKINSYIVSLIEEEDKLKTAAELGVDPNTLVKSE